MPGFLFFPYYGPNRRSDRRVVEIRLQFTEGERIESPRRASDVIEALAAAGVRPEIPFPDGRLPDGDRAQYGSLLAQTALWMQQAGGHRVNFHSVRYDPCRRLCVALAEHEDSQTGVAAVQLAVNLFLGRGEFTRAAWQQYLQAAHDRALPAETHALIEVLRERDIPYFQMEREPVGGKVNTGRRLRRNGLISIGHGIHGEVLDGSLCISRADANVRGLASDIGLRRQLLLELGLVAASRQGTDAAQHATHTLLVVNSRVTTLEHGPGGHRRCLDASPDEARLAATAVSDRVGGQPVAVHLRAATDSGAEFEVLDFELAPDLAVVLTGVEGPHGLLRQACADLVEWLFPPGTETRVPIAAVTGTNGKTTTSRMIAHTFKAAGFRPGLVCTDGIFLDGRLVSEGDGSAFIGHARVLGSRAVDAAVLEAHHRGLAVRGFAFDRCDVAACLNVSNDHLEKGVIETVEHMAVIKRSLLERAHRGAVLNADNPPCISMLPHLKAERVCLFSSNQSRDALARLEGENRIFCLLEQHQGEPWVVFDDGDRRPVLPVAEMPCSFGGAARFNLENAMAAIASCYLVGLPLQAIRKGMGSFVMGRDTTPGRLNHYHGLPFTAVIDFAHNPDGMARLAEFARKRPTEGRRLLMFAGPGSSEDEVIADMARNVAGSFDHYVCRSYPNTRGRPRESVPEILREVLLEADVPPASITFEADAARALEQALGMAAPQDLVILALSRREFQPVHERLVAMQAEVRQHGGR